MKICAFEVRQDEREFFLQMSQMYQCDTVLYKETLNPETISFAEGADAVTILGQSKIDREILSGLCGSRIRFLNTRTVGYDHIDLDSAKEFGIRVCHSGYAPNGVADYTVMLMLLVLRHYKPALWRGEVYDYSLKGLMGREMKDLTVGIIGTGKIGSCVIRNLSGFGCRILACSPTRRPDMETFCKYVDLNTLYRECDLISLHTPLNDRTYHMINHESIESMKHGVILINCARGELMELDALVDGIENGQIGGLGLDTVEGEQGLVHVDHRTDILKLRHIAYLRQFPNVVMTQHMAFYTDAAVRSMVKTAYEGLTALQSEGSSMYLV